jgi:peptide-methionine (R)-S-oxide reductase
MEGTEHLTGKDIESRGRGMRSGATRRDFLWMMGAAAGFAVGSTLPGFLGRGGSGSGSSVPAAVAADGPGPTQIKVYSAEKGTYVMTQPVVKTTEEWKKTLTAEQYHILREKGTERAFTGKFDKNHEHGVYRCAGCGLDLYRSEEKFDSGTGWPSFTAPIAASNVLTRPDNSFFTQRTEVLCPRCGGHLGHVFDDGPKPTGKRYCMNSAALQFVATTK